MKKIVVLDTWVNDTNLGNKVIMEAVSSVIQELFPHDFVYSVPALEYVRAGRHLVEAADHVFLAGTNLLSADMNRTSEWRLRLSDCFWMKNVVLLGVGWWQYQSRAPNLYTRFLLKGILSRGAYHSVRDSYTAGRLKELGFRVLNTGCPTIWKLDAAHCASIPTGKGARALLTFTEYNRNPESDRFLYETVRANYAEVCFWPQQYGDHAYARTLCGDGVTMVDPSIEALYAVLSQPEVDYVGTRLHAGIAALRHGRRTLIVAVDNRAAEMGRDFDLPIIARERLSAELETKINAPLTTAVRLNGDAIACWKRQFG